MFSSVRWSRKYKFAFSVSPFLILSATAACGHNTAELSSGGSASVPSAGGASTSGGGRLDGELGGASGTGGNTSESGATSTGFIFPAPVAPWQPSQACVEQVAHLLTGMTLRQKAGQMVQADSAGITAADVATYQFGSVFSGGSSDPDTDDLPQTWRSFVESFETQAGSFGIPLIYAIDAVHGNNNVSNAVIFPHNIGLGATRDAALVREVGHITALEMRGTSIDWNFAPAISAAQNERWGRTLESYSEVPALAAELGVAMLEGLQGDSLSGPESVVGCAKHFAGDGATQNGVDQADTVLDEPTFRKLGVEVYQPLINAGVGSIMVSYSSYNGIDMLMEPYVPAQDVDLLEAASTASGPAYIPISRIDDAVTRILTIKCEHGMLAQGYDPSGDSALLAEIGSQAHRDVARRAVRESAVLLRNEKAVLPLPESAVVHVSG